MYRIEIISNKSVEDDLVDALSGNLDGFLYTKIPLAYGKGGDDMKLGTATWPETNFILLSYIADEWLETAKAVVAAVKKKFPREGITFFAVRAEDL